MNKSQSVQGGQSPRSKATTGRVEVAQSVSQQVNTGRRPLASKQRKRHNKRNNQNKPSKQSKQHRRAKSVKHHRLTAANLNQLPAPETYSCFMAKYDKFFDNNEVDFRPEHSDKAVGRWKRKVKKTSPRKNSKPKRSVSLLGKAVKGPNKPFKGSPQWFNQADIAKPGSSYQSSKNVSCKSAYVFKDKKRHDTLYPRKFSKSLKDGSKSGGLQKWHGDRLHPGIQVLDKYVDTPTLTRLQSENANTEFYYSKKVKTGSPHSYLRAESQMCLDFMSKHVRDLGYTRIIDAGGNAELHTFHRDGVHSTCPIVNQADQARHGHYEKYNKTRKKDVMKYKFCRCTLKQTVSGSCNSCFPDIQTAIISNQALYYFEKDSIAQAVYNSGLFLAGVHRFDAKPRTNTVIGEGTYSIADGVVTMKVPGERYKFIHDDMAWLSGSYFTTKYGPVTWRKLHSTHTCDVYEFIPYNTNLKPSVLKGKSDTDSIKRKMFKVDLVNSASTWYLLKPYMQRSQVQLKNHIRNLLKTSKIKLTIQEIAGVVSAATKKATSVGLSLTKNSNINHMKVDYATACLDGTVGLYSRMKFHLGLYVEQAKQAVADYVWTNKYSLFCGFAQVTVFGIAALIVTKYFKTKKYKPPTIREYVAQPEPIVYPKDFKIRDMNFITAGSTDFTWRSAVPGLFVLFDLFANLCSEYILPVGKAVVSECSNLVSEFLNSDLLIADRFFDSKDDLGCKFYGPEPTLVDVRAGYTGFVNRMSKMVSDKVSSNCLNLNPCTKAEASLNRISGFGSQRKPVAIAILGFSLFIVAKKLFGYLRKDVMFNYKQRCLYGRCNADIPDPELDDNIGQLLDVPDECYYEKCIPEQMFISVGPYCWDYSPVAIMTCAHNELTTMMARVLGKLTDPKYTKEPDKPTCEEFTHFVDGFKDTIFGNQNQECQRVDTKEWLDHFKVPSKKKMYTKLMEERDYNLVDIPFVDKVRYTQAFPKKELLCKDEDKVEIHGRMVQGRIPLFNVIWSRLIYSYSNCLKTVWGKYHYPYIRDSTRFNMVTYASGFNRNELGNSWKNDVDYIDGLPGTTVFMMSDFSKMDRHETIYHLQVAWSIIAHFFDVTIPEARCHWHTLHTIGYTRCGIKYCCYGQMKSGDQITSCVNSTLTGTGWLFSAWKASGKPAKLTTIPFRAHVHGDDTASVLKLWLLKKILEEGTWVKLGFTIKLQKEPIYRMEFCSSLFVPIKGGVICAPKPGRMLLKTFYVECTKTSLLINPKKQAAYVHGVCVALIKDVACFPFMVDLFNKLIELTAEKSNKVWFDRFTKYKQLKRIHAVEDVQMCQATFDYIYDRYGITKAMMESFRKRISGLKHFNVGIADVLVKIIVQVDAYDIFPETT
jgi:hypothetical protein